VKIAINSDQTRPIKLPKTAPGNKQNDDWLTDKNRPSRDRHQFSLTGKSL
jgi:hypothetical protein